MAREKPDCPSCGTQMVITHGYGKERRKQAFECLNCGCIIRGFTVMNRTASKAAQTFQQSS